MKIRLDGRQNIVMRAASLLSSAEKKKIFAVMIVQTLMGGLDLLAVAAVGVLGSLAVTGVSSQDSGSRISKILELFHLGNLSFQTQAATLAIGASTLMIMRTVLSVFFNKKVMYFLSRRSAVISTNLLRRLLSQSLLFVQGRTTQQTLYSLTHGVTIITLGIIGTAITAVADVSLLAVLIGGLFVVDAATTLGMVLGVGFIGLFLYRVLHQKAHLLGTASAELEVASNEKIIEVLSSYREAIVRNRRSYYAEEIGNYRFQLSNTQAELSFLPSISKYVVESSVVIGGLILSGVQFYAQDARHAVATLAIFIAAGSRIAPAALRLQQSAIQLRITAGAARPTLDLIESLWEYEIKPESIGELNIDHEGFLPEVQVKNVSLTYPSKTSKALDNVTLEIPEGATVAIVGPSGAGKTSLIDVILGVIQPDSGQVTISSVSPSVAPAKWPGAIAYVPQDVLIVSGSLKHNVSLGYPDDADTTKLAWDALSLAKLKNFVSQLPQGIETEVGERGSSLSGGQRQRLGIARALFTQPRLLVLDEATSALDGQTELEISEALHDLRGKTTVLMIAHRLSTVRNADQVIYMDNGKIIAKGSFNDVRRLVPNFDKQAKLMGL